MADFDVLSTGKGRKNYFGVTGLTISYTFDSFRKGKTQFWNCCVFADPVFLLTIMPIYVRFEALKLIGEKKSEKIKKYVDKQRVT